MPTLIETPVAIIFGKVPRLAPSPAAYCYNMF